MNFRGEKLINFAVDVIQHRKSKLAVTLPILLVMGRFVMTFDASTRYFFEVYVFIVRGIKSTARIICVFFHWHIKKCESE